MPTIQEILDRVKASPNASTREYRNDDLKDLVLAFWCIGQRGRHDCNGDGKYKSVKASFG